MANTSSSPTPTLVNSSYNDDQTCRKKTAKDAEEEEDDHDRISRLPNEILGHILSSFPTRYVVQTSILSKRWRYVWTFAPSIEISDCETRETCKTPKIKRDFMDFIDRVLRLNDVSCLRELNLDCDLNYTPSRITKLMRSVSKRASEKLILAFSKDQRVKLPPSLFTCTQLVFLFLGSGIVPNAPKSVHFPSLKNLHIALVQFFDDDSMKDLLAGCPVLEELNIDRDEYDTSISTLFIQSNSLKNLTLDICDEDSYDNCEVVIVIEAPNLEIFHLSDYATIDYKVSSMPSLASVHLDLREGLPSIIPNGSTLAELLGSMSNTKYLDLSENTFQYFKPAPLHNLPIFHNLTRLNVQFLQSSGEVWPYIVDRAPNITTLQLEKTCMHTCTHVECEWRPPSYVPAGLSLHLEIIDFFGFEACVAEMEMVGYLLKNARVLKKMEIFFWEPEENAKLKKELSVLPKGSAACQIKVR